MTSVLAQNFRTIAYFSSLLQDYFYKYAEIYKLQEGLQ